MIDKIKMYCMSCGTCWMMGPRDYPRACEACGAYRWQRWKPNLPAKWPSHDDHTVRQLANPPLGTAKDRRKSFRVIEGGRDA